MNKKLASKAEKMTSSQSSTSSSSVDTSKKPNKEKKKEWVRLHFHPSPHWAIYHANTYGYFRNKSNVTVRLFQCCALNGGIFLLSILFFDYILMAYLKNIITYFMGQSTIWNFIQTTLSWIFSFIWIVPLFVLSKIINTFWFQDIADAAYEFRKGRPTLIPSLSKLLADVVFSLIVQSLFLFQVS